jgi:peptidoglycan biosynthesis protein MviN/MurJ (putative lipid II flippase)
VLAAGILRYVTQLAVVRPRFYPIGSFHPWLISSDLARRYWQAMLSGGILFIYPVAARAYASQVGEGGVAMFTYAMRLIELPLLLCVSFLSVVLLPRLADAYSYNREAFLRLVVYGVQTVFVLGFTTVCTLFVGRHGYTEIVYGRGLQSGVIDEISKLVAVGILCVLFQGAATFMTAVLNSARKTQIPLILNILGGIGFFIVLKLSSNISLLSIMIALTSTYGVLAIIYMLVVRCVFSFSGLSPSSNSIPFIIGVMAVSGIFSLGHWLILSVVSSIWLSLLTTIVAGCVTLIAAALCHSGIRKLAFKVNL